MNGAVPGQRYRGRVPALSGPAERSGRSRGVVSGLSAAH